MIIKNIDRNKADEIIAELDDVSVERLPETIKIVADDSSSDYNILYKFPESKSYIIVLDYKSYDYNYCMFVESQDYYGIDILLFDRDETEYVLKLQNVFNEQDILD